MEPNGNELTQFYDDLKSKIHPQPHHIHSGPAPMNVGTGYTGSGLSPIATNWRNMAVKVSEGIKDRCRKHILLDIYVKTLPLDDDFKAGNMGMMRDDVDKMLADKNMTATQYLTSAAKATRAPLLEYVLRATDMIGQQYMEEADEKLKDAQAAGVKLPPPQDDEDDENVQGALVDVKDDTEYDTFVDELKKKTIDKIVSDVTAIINKEKEDSSMEFNPKPEAGAGDDEVPAPEEPIDDAPATESAVGVALHYLQKHAIMESVEITPEKQEDMIGMAIREATLNEIDKVFKMPGSDLRSFSTKIRLGRGIIVK